MAAAELPAAATVLFPTGPYHATWLWTDFTRNEAPRCPLARALRIRLLMVRTNPGWDVSHAEPLIRLRPKHE